MNFHHYQIQRLVNFTSLLAEGVHEQLSATSIMTFQNRKALDALLAEKGGVCAMIGDSYNEGNERLKSHVRQT